MQTVSREELAAIIGEKTLHVSDKKRLVASIADFLTSQQKPIDIDSLMRDVMQYRQDKGIIEATVISAHDLTPSVEREVRELLKEHFPKAKKIILDSRIDDAVVGGIKIELPREVLDLSIRTKLNVFKRLVAEENK